MEIVSASYFLMMFLTICVAVAGIFGPHSIERSSNHLSPDRLNKLHCRIFGNCIFFGGIFLLGGLLEIIGTAGMIVAGEVLFFGAMYFIGLLANESDKARVAREKRRAEQERLAAELQRARVAQEQLEAERQAAAAEALRRETKRLYALFCYLIFVDYIQGVEQSLMFHDFDFDPECLHFDEGFMLAVEGAEIEPEERVFWRAGLLFSCQNPHLKSAQPFLERARDLVMCFVDKELA